MDDIEMMEVEGFLEEYGDWLFEEDEPYDDYDE